MRFFLGALAAGLLCGVVRAAEPIVTAEEFERYERLVEQECRSGEGDSCYMVWLSGKLLLRGEGRPRDPIRALALLELACGQGLTYACSSLGEMYRKGDGVERDVARALEWYEKACRHPIPHAHACGVIASVHFYGDGTRRDRDRAASYAEEACAETDGAGCTILGLCLALGEGRPRDRRRAIELFEGACEFQDWAPACYSLGVTFESNSALDLPRAAELYERACIGGHGGGCRLLGRMCEVGRWKHPSQERAVSWYRKACELGDEEGCAARKRLEADATRPARRGELERACHGGDARQCWELAHLWLRGDDAARDPPKGVAYLERACTGGFGTACQNLATRYKHGVGVEKDAPRALEFMRRGCDLGSGVSCGMVGQLFERGEDVEENGAIAAAWYARACRTEHPSCFQLANSLRDGQFVQRDVPRAARLLNGECQRDAWWACRALAELLEQGDGISKDPERAARLYAKACELGDLMICARARPAPSSP